MRHSIFNYSGLVLAGLLLAAPVARMAGQLPAPPKPVIDNDRVRVWQNVQPMGAAGSDAVAISLEPVPAARFIQKGDSASGGNGLQIAVGGAQASSPGAQPALFIELKDHLVPALANTSGYPDAFPRAGIHKLLDNDRVTVWDYRWTVGEPTEMHFHSRDVVVMFLEDGPLESTTPDGKKTVNHYTPQTVRFNARDRVHFETLLEGKQRAVIVELKP